LFTSIGKTVIKWQLETTFQTFDLYRGSLERLLSSGEYTQDPSAEPEAARWCQLMTNQQSDTHIPAAGHANHYLVTGVNGAVEGTLGTRSDGTPRQNDHPCP
jgi:hypothetical protein